MPGVTWWKLTNSIMVRRAGRKPTFARPAASVSLGSEQTFAGDYDRDHGHQPRRFGGAARSAVACCFHAFLSAIRSFVISRSRSSAARNAAFSASRTAVPAGSVGGAALIHSEPLGVPIWNTLDSSEASIV